MINIVDLSTVGIVKRGIRAVWDAFMFHAVIKKRACIPASDSFICVILTHPVVHFKVCKNLNRIT